MATMVRGTSRNVTLYVHCLHFSILEMFVRDRLMAMFEDCLQYYEKQI